MRRIRYDRPLFVGGNLKWLLADPRRSLRFHIRQSDHFNKEATHIVGHEWERETREDFFAAKKPSYIITVRKSARKATGIANMNASKIYRTKLQNLLTDWLDDVDRLDLALDKNHVVRRLVADQGETIIVIKDGNKPGKHFRIIVTEIKQP